MVGCGRTVYAAADPIGGKPHSCEKTSMCEKNENPTNEASDETTAPAAAAGLAALAGLVVGTLVGGPALGIAFALIFGIQAGVTAATGHDVDSNDIS
jgi:predicted lipid-binding transport protein (Tim44 family)